MKDKVKGLVVGIIIGTMITGGTALAASKTKIEVLYENLRYMIDGVEKKPTAGEGFIYQGTTYVPLRFAGEALGKDVSWDGKNKTIWIGDKIEGYTYLSDIEYARAEDKAIENLYLKEWKYPAGLNFHIASNKYLNGMGIILYGNDSGKLSYNLNGEYKKLTALIGVDDYTKNSTTIGRVTIIGDGKELYRVTDLTGGNHAEEISINLSGVLKMEILFEGIVNPYRDQIDIVIAEPKLIK